MLNVDNNIPLWRVVIPNMIPNVRGLFFFLTFPINISSLNFFVT